MTSLSFRNEPLRDFSEAHHRDEVANAIIQVEERIMAGDFTAKPVVEGQVFESRDIFQRNDPSRHGRTVGRIHFADLAVTERAIASCHAGFPAWRATPWSVRADSIRKAAEIMRVRKAYLTALIVFEAGKPWREADGDVAEAIDFCMYYAEHAERMGASQLTEGVLGEMNLYSYQPRGITAVISPWNFPLAITCGMTVAALVTGNAVILKPAEQSSLIAAELAAILLESGVPSDAFAFLPGRGEVVGSHLVSHPQTAMIAFTGSRAVGLEIIKAAAQITPGQRGIKRVVAELGGKNAIIVDEDADMDDAVRGVLTSAFGYAGQKCSACSRVIIVRSAYEPFVERFSAATKDLIIGEACDPSVALGPVIDFESFERISETISRARKDLPLSAEGQIPDELRDTGYFIPPTIFKDVPTDHSLWREEIFGPVVGCTKANSFEEALEMALDSDYALTGGVFSRHPRHIQKALEEFRVGNLYINRGITGALVGRQPFGGFAFSGIGSKAGGPDYLLQFVEPRATTENTMRRGFTPDLG